MEEIALNKSCKACQQIFGVYDGDLPFYRRLEIEPPSLCFDSKCGVLGASSYPPESATLTYCESCYQKDFF